jgi:hypothetical protein
MMPLPNLDIRTHQRFDKIWSLLRAWKKVDRDEYVRLISKHWEESRVRHFSLADQHDDEN